MTTTPATLEDGLEGSIFLGSARNKQNREEKDGERQKIECYGKQDNFLFGKAKMHKCPFMSNIP